MRFKLIKSVGQTRSDDVQSFYLLSLGCSKNLVDSECMSQLLREAGMQAVSAPEDADILIVNTCGFIESAKQEAISAILELADYKQPKGKARALLVTGCLAQRYTEQMRIQMPEIDAILGTKEYGRIVDVIHELTPDMQAGHHIDRQMSGARDPGKPFDPDSIAHLRIDRLPSTPRPYAYVKIAEGCSNHCAYCAIPGIQIGRAHV